MSILDSRISQRISRPEDIGALIALARKRKKMTQTMLADGIQTSRKTISDLENGSAKNISFATVLNALMFTGLVLDVSLHRKPTIEEVLKQRAFDQQRTDALRAKHA